jgi:pyruvate dehydrogenase E2 component (dihydrolipoamide acetyltransferase)
VGDGRQPQAATSESARLIVSPLAARMAAEAGLDVRSLQGSGPGGRIIKRDIEAALSQPKAAPAPAFPRVVEPGRFRQAAASAYRDEPASEIRKTIAKRLVTSLGPVPHFFLTTEIEMDRAAEMRRGINALDPDLKISINDIIIKVAAAGLIQHPEVNASFQEKFIRYYEHADVGVAVAIEEGLITPVVRSADQKSLSEIAAEVRELAERARSRKLKPEEYTGASFSISNLGMFGIDEFTAVINPPEGAILAVGAMGAKPVVRDNEIVIRQMMRVTMSCDHRVIDGATGAKFLQTFKKILENPLYLVV